MIQRRSTFFLGLFIFLIPFLGLPSSSKTVFIILSGLGLIALSVKIALPATVTSKMTKHRKPKKPKVTYVPMDASMDSGSTGSVLPADVENFESK